jgi:glutathione synthase/RimK-type ligase-like ATP-grasp enzyme
MFAVRVTCSGPVDLETLAALDALVARRPDALDLAFARACLLEDLGRLAAAARAYADILARDPAHRGALINAATAAYVDGRTTAAHGLYRRAVDAAPDDPVALVDLANVLADLGRTAESRAAYERALARDPAHAVAQIALADLLTEAGDPAAAAARARAFAEPIVHVTPATATAPLRVLVPFAANGGNLVTTLFFDRARVETIELVAESFDGVLPAHDLIVNAVADADRSGAALAAAERIARASGRPCLNPPSRVASTGRTATGERLAAIPGVVVPHALRLARHACTAAALEAAGFAFPVLLRAPGYHAGRHFVRVASAAGIDDALAALPGDDVLAIAFVDTRAPGERYRKYRMLAIDGALYPLHLASARVWKVHYFSSDNAVRAASRTAEAAYLADPRAHLGERAYAALEAIARAMALDYGGIDFALDARGDVVVFEANASFAIYYPGDDATAAYRRPAAEAAVAAVRAMIARRASGGGAVWENGPLDDGEHLAPT